MAGTSGVGTIAAIVAAGGVITFGPRHFKVSIQQDTTPRAIIYLFIISGITKKVGLFVKPNIVAVLARGFFTASDK
jgi:hypothetical protein